MSNKKKKKVKKQEEEFELKKLNVSKPIMVLSMLSLLGFMFSVISDFSYFTGLGAVIQESFGDNVGAQLAYSANINKWKEAGFDVSPDGLRDIRQMFLVLGLINIPVLLGVGLMFFRVKIGFNIYTVFQLAYIFVPIYLVGFKFYPNFRLLSYGDMAFMLLFIIMYGIQRNNLGLEEVKK